jgi:hypothetical protein
MARAFVLGLAALLIAMLILAVAAPVRAAGGDGLRQAANARRQGSDLARVVGTALLDDIATRRAARMVQEDALEHDVAYVVQRLNGAGVCWSGMGEIIAWERGYPDYDDDRTVQQWWNSPPHREVMMGAAYNAAGAAWDTAADGGHYSVMVFVTLCGDTIASGPDGLLYPDDRYRPNRELVLRDRRVTAYRLGRSGAVRAQKSVRLSSTTRVDASGRARANGKAWLKVSSGALVGYRVHETTDTFVRGVTEKKRLSPGHRVALQPGRHMGTRFDWLGRVTASRSHTFDERQAVRASAFAVVNGRRYYLLSAGPLDGYWVRDTPAVDPA